MRIVDIDERNVAETGFFCMMSKRKSAGYRRKLRWLEARFAEGLRIKLLDLSMGGRGFIEYVPGEYAWRPVEAAGYMFIHCLWVVGKSKGNGYAKLLLDRCVADARRHRMRGVTMVTSEANWLVGKAFLVGQGFESVDRAAPSFELMVKRFGRATPPSFPDDWARRAKRFGKGLTVVRSDQCPYLENITDTAVAAGRERGLGSRVVELESAREVRERSPSPYGVWTLLVDGSVLCHNYVVKKKLLGLLDDRKVAAE